MCWGEVGGDWEGGVGGVGSGMGGVEGGKVVRI